MNLNFENCTGMLVILVMIAVILWLCFRKETFISGGTVSQLFSKDAQDMYINGPEIKNYTNNDFNLEYDMPTRLFDINRGYPTKSTEFKQFDSYLGDEFIVPQPDLYGMGSVKMG